ncbi:glycosyltransferase [Curtobacterium sp. BRD11]|uniref:glycosyltransferase n=1 Tax=Curtobacterium sp. BRD11 TaxID=2962581 RepID=UPI002881F4A6|nr:glycosyltransferase [Curtobacterium sp. BRD11]MDT0211474.1 glycosyltransferase [Curtobacterium sp. BRD11]
MLSVSEVTPETNPYISMLVDGLKPVTNLLLFDRIKLISRKVDVLHVHWPESLIRGGSRPKKAAKYCFAIAFLLLPRRLRAKIVWTQHNRDPHENGGPLEGLFLRLFRSRVDHTIYINASPENDLTVASSTILHSEYERLTDLDEALVAARKCDFLFFGLLRPYKAIEQLIDAFKQMPPNASLRLVGQASVSYAAQLRKAASSKPCNIEIDSRFLSESDLQTAISATRWVVLPNPEMYNSGAAILALSLGKPVLVPATPSNRALQDEFGEQWVRLFTPPLDATDLAGAAARAAHTGRPSLERRSWTEAIAAHVVVYEKLADTPPAQKQRASTTIREKRS